MIYLELNCKGCNTMEELCIKTCETLITLSKTSCCIGDEIDFDMSCEKTLDNIDDIITGYDFKRNSCRFIIYNFNDARVVLKNLSENYISIFEDVHKEYPKDFVYEIYEDDNFVRPKTLTYEFIDLENEK